MVAFKEYHQVLDYLMTQLPMYQRQGKAAYKADLENSNKLDELLGYPHRAFKSIHVAGTNGKGSVCNYLASILMEAGFKVGLHTSPHLTDYRERILVNGNLIPEEDVIEFVNAYKSQFDCIKPSFFEMSVFMAFWYFRKVNVDFAVIEVGMGGRLDSTNVITPELSVITNIGLDHTQFLGDTHESIAAEKAGIIKNNVPVLIGERQKETETVFKDVCHQKKSKLIFASGNETGELGVEFSTEYQKKNISTTIAAIRLLNELNALSISEEVVRKGINNVSKNTGFKGRWQVLQEKPLVVLDTGHNAEGIAYVVDKIKSITQKQVFVVLSFVDDKNIKNVIDILPKEWNYIITESTVPRAIKKEVLANTFSANGIKKLKIIALNKVLEYVLNIADPEDVIWIGGSTFLVADILNFKKL